MKNKKTTYSLLILMVLIVGLMPLNTLAVASPRVVATTTVAAPVTTGVTPKAEIVKQIKEQIRERINDSNTKEDCVRLVKEKFPEADEERISTECRQMIQSMMKRASAESRTYVNARVQADTAEWKLKALENLADKRPAVKEFVKNMGDDAVKKFMYMSREEQKELLEKGAVRAQEDLQKYRMDKINVTNLYRVREVAKDRLERARELYNNAKEKYIQAQNRFRDEKQKFENAVKSGDEDAAKEHAKKLLSETADMVIQSLEKLKEKTNGNDDLTEDEVEEMIADLDGKIAVMEQAKADVEVAESKEDIKEAGRKIISAWNKEKYLVKVHAYRLIKSKVQDVLKRSEQLERRVDNLLIKLEEKGYDISDLDAMNDEFSLKIAEARENFKTADEKLREAHSLAVSDDTDQEEIDRLAEEAKGLVQDAHGSLEEAHEIFKNMFREYKNMTGSDELFEETAENEYYEVFEDSNGDNPQVSVDDETHEDNPQISADDGTHEENPQASVDDDTHEENPQISTDDGTHEENPQISADDGTHEENESFSELCENSGGNWSSGYDECTGLSESDCDLIKGDYICASPCRHDPDAEACIASCEMVCYKEYESDNEEGGI